MYALNTRKGTTINHPDVILKGGVAVPVTDSLAIQLKDMIDIVVFEKVAGKGDEVSKPKHLYNLNPNSLKVEKNNGKP